MNGILVTHLPGAAESHRDEHPGYAYHKQTLVPGEDGHGCRVSVYTLPPGLRAGAAFSAKRTPWTITRGSRRTHGLCKNSGRRI